MRKGRVCCLAVSILFAAACCTKSRPGPAGDGNIPIGELGKELADINFDFDSHRITQNAQATLQKNGKWLLDNPGRNVVVEGHCDERGTNEYNMALGDLRARSVRNFLRGMGVPETQMSTISYGEEVPLVNESNQAAWAKNRRAHFSAK